MKRFLLVLSSVFALLAAVPYSSYAAFPSGPGGAACCKKTCGRGGMMGGRMWMSRGRRPMMPGLLLFKNLGLSRKQEEEIRQTRSGLLKVVIRKRAGIAIARVELMDLLRQDHVDMRAVGAKLKEIASLQTDLRLARIKAFESIKSELTPAQRAKFRENLRGFFWMRGRRMGMNACGGKPFLFRDRD